MKLNITKMIDLHLHLDGAISIESARELASMQNISIPESDQELLKLMRVSPSCKDLNEFLEKFAFPCSLIQTHEGLSTAVYNLCEELKQQGIIYAEIRFAPSKSCDKGMTQEQAVQAAIEGMNKSTLRAGLILCCMRGDSYEINAETIRIASKYLGKGVCAADLAGAEALFKTAAHADVFKLARELNVPFEIHAGEADGPSSIYSALEFGASRIGHGVKSVEDSALVRLLAERRMPLMVCPTSNVQTCIAPEISGLPIRRFLDDNIIFTINTDDPSIEGTDLKTEWERVVENFDLSPEEVLQLMLNAVESAFCSEETRAQLRLEIKQAYA